MLKTTLTAALVMLTLSACSSSASLVRKDSGIGGRVQLAGAYMPAMADARMLMVEACQGRFEFVEVGEAVEFRCKSHGAKHAVSGTELAMAGSSKGL
jgi:hypothetical protein